MIDLYYAEDDPNIANTVKEYLEQKDFKVTIYDTLASIKQALEIHVLQWFFWIGICRMDEEIICVNGSAAHGRNFQLSFLRFVGIPVISYRGFKTVRMTMW